MKKIVFILISTIVLLTSSCNKESYYKDPTHSTIKELYTCDLMVSKNISVSTEEGSQTTLVLEIENSAVINQEDYNLKYAGSLIPLFTYRNLTIEGLEEITHIETKIIQNIGSMKSEHTFNYSISDLQKASKSFDNVAGYITEKHNSSNEEIAKYFNLEYVPKTDLFPYLDQLKNIDRDNGGSIESNIIGFELAQLKNGEKGILIWNYLEYKNKYAVIQFVHPYTSEEYKIIGFELL